MAGYYGENCNLYKKIGKNRLIILEDDCILGCCAVKIIFRTIRPDDAGSMHL
jgi:hypothetical protein